MEINGVELDAVSSDGADFDAVEFDCAQHASVELQAMGFDVVETDAGWRLWALVGGFVVVVAAFVLQLRVAS